MPVPLVPGALSPQLGFPIPFNSDQVASVDNGAALRQFRIGMSRMLNGGAVVDWFGLGDSVTEGWNSAGWFGSYLLRARDEVFRQLGLSGGGRYVRLSPNDFGTPIFTGGTDTQNGGMGQRGSILAAAGGSSGVISVTCDRALFNYGAVNFFGGTGNLKVDGVVVGTASQADGSIPALASRGDLLLDSGVLALAAHNLEITSTHATVQAGLNAGIYCSNQDFATLRCWNGGRFGQNTPGVWNGTAPGSPPPLPSGTIGMATDLIAGLQGELVTINLGLNDYQSGNPAGGSQVLYQNLSGLILQIRAGTFRYVGTTFGGQTCNPSIVLIVPWATGAVTRPGWDSYRAAIYRVAQDLGCAVFDWWSLAGNANNAAVSSDQLHPNAATHRMIGTALARFLLQVL